MGSSTVGYKKADYGNFNEYIIDKIKSARNSAAEERKYADDRIENLSKKEERTDEEEQLLKQLVEERSTRKKGSFFGKALAHEFGGDLLRRTKGTFSSDPSKTEDPASSKRERFSALIRGDIMRPQENVVSPEPMKQLDLPLDSTDKEAVKVEDVGLKKWLSTVFDGIIKNNNDVSKRLSSLGQQNKEQISTQDDSSSILSKIVGSVDKLKTHFDKNNKLQQEENNINSKQLELNLDSQNKQEMTDESSSIAKTTDTSSSVSYKKPLDQEDDNKIKDGGEEGGGGGAGILGKILDILDFLPVGRGLKALRRLRKINFGGLGGVFKRFRGGRRTPSMVPPVKPMAEGGFVEQPQQNVQPTTGIVDLPSLSVNKQKQESTPVKVQPTKMSSGGRITAPVGKQKDITQNSSEVKRKLAEGGIFDNPTKLTVREPGSFIPLYRNNPLRNAFSQTNITNRTVNKGAVDKTSQGKGYADPLAKIIQLPTMAAGGLLLSTMTSVFQNLGGIGKFLKPFLDKMMGPVATVFGLPTSILGSMFGGAPAQAATLDAKDIADFLKGGKGKKGKKGGSGGGGGGGNNTPPPPGTETQYNVTGGQKITADMFGRGMGVRDGLGSGNSPTGHTGRDVGLPEGTPLSVSAPGTVVDVGNIGDANDPDGTNGGYGNFVVIKLDDGRYIKSAHHKRNLVRTGDRVGPQADGSLKVIGEVGSTGLSTGPHMHLDLASGYEKGSAKMLGLMNPDNFILGGGIIRGGNASATAAGQYTPGAPAPNPSGNPQRPSTPPPAPAQRPPTQSPARPSASGRPTQGPGSPGYGEGSRNQQPQSPVSQALNSVVTTAVRFDRFVRSSPLSYIPGWP